MTLIQRSTFYTSFIALENIPRKTSGYILLNSVG